MSNYFDKVLKLNKLSFLSVEETEFDVAEKFSDRIQALCENLETTFTDLEEKHALEVIQLVRQKKAYQMKLKQVGLRETERRVAVSLDAQKARYVAKYRPGTSSTNC